MSGGADEGVAGAVVEDARAKVNLTLHVTGRRADGYHLLDSLVVFAPVADRVRVAPADRLSFGLEGPFGLALARAGGDGEDNLVLRAARVLARASGREARVRITLEKNLPVASGIGGGSADAAAALRALGRLWRVDAPPAADVLALGADVPVCLADRPALMRGIGEVLLPAPTLPDFSLILVNPGVAVSTGAVFAEARASGLRAAPALPSGWADAGAMAETLARSRNDLEAPAIGIAPAIGEVLEALRGLDGCLLARMSGSGATCFGLFADAGRARAGATALEGRGWWVAAGRVGETVDGCAREGKRTVS